MEGNEQEIITIERIPPERWRHSDEMKHSSWWFFTVAVVKFIYDSCKLRRVRSSTLHVTRWSQSETEQIYHKFNFPYNYNKVITSTWRLANERVLNICFQRKFSFKSFSALLSLLTFFLFRVPFVKCYVYVKLIN